MKSEQHLELLPPPEILAVPWGYLSVLMVAAAVSIGAAVINTQRTATWMVIEHLRGL